MNRRIVLTAALLGLAGQRTATAAPGGDAPAAYAIVVGSNSGGAGQEALRWAEDDARRVAGLLSELGGYPEAGVRLVLHPTPAALLDAVDQVRAHLQADADAGRPAMLFFYYSGHARASALELGGQELAVTALRERLESLPSSLTVVVLDACQSGSFSRIKGAGPAADFSFNSLSALAQTGMAVLASSSATELSQESERLRSSYFTHHLLVGLRGAGDGDRDGRVTLDEAYRYAYNQTLAATAATAIGKQHVTLEVDLKGKGEVALTWPGRADAHLVLPAALRGDVLVQVQPAGTVVAEIHKAAGRPVDLAVRSGSYLALVREGKQAHECELAVARGARAVLDTSGCRPVDLQAGAAKGGDRGGPAMWALEVAVGAGFGRNDAFVRRLEDFGYQEDFDVINEQITLGVAWEHDRRLAVVGELSRLDGRSFRRESDPSYQHYSFTTTALTLSARATYPLFGGLLRPFVQAGGGVATATDDLENHDGATDTTTTTGERHWGFVLGAAAGLQLVPPWSEGHAGLYLRGGYAYAPVLGNLLGETHDSGGASIGLGIRGAY